MAEKELKAAFKQFDVDNSSFLDKNEFTQIMKGITSAFHVEEPTISDINDIMVIVDRNGDGRITEK